MGWLGEILRERRMFLNSQSFFFLCFSKGYNKYKVFKKKNKKKGEIEQQQTQRQEMNS